MKRVGNHETHPISLWRKSGFERARLLACPEPVEGCRNARTISAALAAEGCLFRSFDFLHGLLGMKRRAPGRRSRPCWNRRAPGFMREFTPASRCPSMYICLSMNRRGFFWHSFLKAVKQMTSRKLRGAREKFWQDRYYDSNVHFRAGPLRGDPLYPSQSGVPGARTLCAGVESGVPGARILCAGVESGQAQTGCEAGGLQPHGRRPIRGDPGGSGPASGTTQQALREQSRSNRNGLHSGGEINWRVAPVSVTFPIPDEGAPGPSPLGTGDSKEPGR